MRHRLIRTGQRDPVLLYAETGIIQSQKTINDDYDYAIVCYSYTEGSFE